MNEHAGCAGAAASQPPAQAAQEAAAAAEASAIAESSQANTTTLSPLGAAVRLLPFYLTMASWGLCLSPTLQSHTIT